MASTHPLADGLGELATATSGLGRHSCLNEAENIERACSDRLATLREGRISGEVVVADNDSTTAARSLPLLQAPVSCTSLVAVRLRISRRLRALAAGSS